MQTSLIAIDIILFSFFLAVDIMLSCFTDSGKASPTIWACYANISAFKDNDLKFA